MSTPNFATMENFPLYAMSDDHFESWACPDCSCDHYGYPKSPVFLIGCNTVDKAGEMRESWECPVCECYTESPADDMCFHAFNCDDYAWWYENDVLPLIEQINANLIFHEVSIKAGYYAHSQFYVETKENPYEMDNYETRYYFDLCRSAAIRKYDAEIRKIRKWLDKNAPAIGMQKLVCVAVFSNGEAIYSEVK